MKRFVPLTLITVCLLAGCVSTQPPPKLNPLQIQTMQTQEFNAPKKKTFNAVMTVLQNGGYVIQTADLDTGFITGKSPTQSGDWGSQGTFSVTAFVTPTKKDNKTYSRVRLSFVENRIISQGRTSYTESSQILDTSLYKKTFNDIRQQVFVAGSVN